LPHGCLYFYRSPVRSLQNCPAPQTRRLEASEHSRPGSFPQFPLRAGNSSSKSLFKIASQREAS
jgi:hypothetical protein